MTRIMNHHDYEGSFQVLTGVNRQISRKHYRQKKIVTGIVTKQGKSGSSKQTT